jgi:hypothetical protein
MVLQNLCKSALTPHSQTGNLYILDVMIPKALRTLDQHKPSPAVVTWVSKLLATVKGCQRVPGQNDPPEAVESPAEHPPEEEKETEDEDQDVIDARHDVAMAEKFHKAGDKKRRTFWTKQAIHALDGLRSRGETALAPVVEEVTAAIIRLAPVCLGPKTAAKVLRWYTPKDKTSASNPPQKQKTTPVHCEASTPTPSEKKHKKVPMTHAPVKSAAPSASPAPVKKAIKKPLSPEQKEEADEAMQIIARVAAKREVLLEAVRAAQKAKDDLKAEQKAQRAAQKAAKAAKAAEYQKRLAEQQRMPVAPPEGVPWPEAFAHALRSPDLADHHLAKALLTAIWLGMDPDGVCRLSRHTLGRMVGIKPQNRNAAAREVGRLLNLGVIIETEDGNLEAQELETLLETLAKPGEPSSDEIKAVVCGASASPKKQKQKKAKP